MAGLQRSTETFRRSGSSGLVWEDRFLPGEMDNSKPKEEDAENREIGQSENLVAVGTMERNRSTGGRAYRTGKVSPALDPPSPKVSACGFCGIFSKKGGEQKARVSRR